MINVAQPRLSRRSLILPAATLAACRRARPRLNVLNWSDYLAPDTLQGFEEAHGVEVRYATYESNEELLARVFSGNSGWDVVFPSNYFIEPMRSHRLLQPLNHSHLRNLDHLDPLLRSPDWDRQLDWCVPYMWGATGIAYRRELNPAPARWADLWDERLRGRLTMLDDPADAFGAALKKLGLPLNTPDPDHLRQAQHELLSQKRLVRAYLNAEARDQLVAGDLVAAQLWATTAQQAIDTAPELAFVHPAEGFALYADNAVILRESRRAALAHAFIDYLLEPKVAASVVALSKTATANRLAWALLAPEIRDNPTIHPPPSVMARGEWFLPLPAPAQRLRDRLWTEIKSA